MFADDIKLYRTIRSPEDCLILQRDINVPHKTLLYSMMGHTRVVYNPTITSGSLHSKDLLIRPKTRYLCEHKI